MADAQIAIIDGDQTQVVLAPGENPAIVASIPGPQGPAGAVAAAIDGSAALPSIAFASDTDTGLYRVGANQLGISTGGTQRLVIDANGQIEATSLGTAASPTWTFVGDPNTGIYSPGADQLALSTNGNGRLFVFSDGSISVGSASAAERFYVAGGNIRLDNNRGINFADNAGTVEGALSISSANNLTVASPTLSGSIQYAVRSSSGAHQFFTAGTEKLRITSTGQLSHIGAGSSGSPAVSFSGSAPSNSLVVDSSGNIGIGQSSVTAVFGRTVSNTGAAAATYRVAGASTSAYLFVSDGLGYGGIFQESNHPFIFGVFSGERARIRADGTFEIKGGGTAGSTPAFSVNPSAASNSLVIDSSGRVGIGTSTPWEVLSIPFNAKLSFGSSTYPLSISRDSGGSLVSTIADSYDASAARIDFTMRAGSASQNTPLSILGSGRVGIGTTSPSRALHVSSAASEQVVLASTSGSLAGIYFNPNGSTFTPFFGATGESLVAHTLGNERARIDSSGTFRVKGAGTGGVNDAVQLNGSAPANSLLLDASGRLLVGTSSARSNFFNTSTFSPGIQLEGATDQNRLLSIVSSNISGAGGVLVLASQKSGAVGGNTIVDNGGQLGLVSFQGNDNTEFVEAARIQAEVDGTPGTNDMPGRLVFSTTADGAASPTERLRITSAGVLQVADAGNIAVGTTTGTKIGTATTQKLGFFNKTPVVQPAAVADATDAASVITQLNALLARMRDLGLIAT